MADDYEDLIELGFEGMDKLAGRYYDSMYGWVAKRRHPSHGEGRAQGKGGQRGQAEKWNEAGGRRNETKSGAEEEDQLQGEEEGIRYDDFNDYRGGRYMAPYWEGHDVARRRISQTSQPSYGYAERPFRDGDRRRYAGDMRADDGGGRQLRRRASSYSPHREHQYLSAERRRRHSKPADDDRVTATLMGALAGGLIGGAARSGSMLSTLGGAVVGGIAAREGDKLYDRLEERRDERRERRRKGEH